MEEIKANGNCHHFPEYGGSFRLFSSAPTEGRSRVSPSSRKKSPMSKYGRDLDRLLVGWQVGWLFAWLGNWLVA